MRNLFPNRRSETDVHQLLNPLDADVVVVYSPMSTPLRAEQYHPTTYMAHHCHSLKSKRRPMNIRSRLCTRRRTRLISLETHNFGVSSLHTHANTHLRIIHRNSYTYTHRHDEMCYMCMCMRSQFKSFTATLCHAVANII